MTDPCKCCKCGNCPELCIDGLCVSWVLCMECGNMGTPALSRDKACKNWQDKNEDKTE